MSAAPPDLVGLRSRLLAAAAGSSPVAVFAVDGEGRVLFAEGGAVPLLSEGKTGIDGLFAADAWRETPQLVSAVGQALAGIRFAGDIAAGGRSFAVRLIPLLEGPETVTGVAGLAVETSAPPPREAQPAGNSEILGALLESLPLSVWVLDHRGELLRDNAFARGHGLGALRSAREDDPRGASLVGRVLIDGRETEGVGVARDASGAAVDLRLRGIPLRNGAGSVLGALLMAKPPLPPPAPPSLVEFPAFEFSEAGLPA